MHMFTRYFRNFLLAGLLVIAAMPSASARDGYKIQLKFTDIKDTLVYLAHYYGKPLPTIYRRDSVKLDKNGVGTMQTKEKIVGGIYMILLSDKATYFDFLLNNGDDITINASIKGLPLSVKFIGSEENNHFLEYGRFLSTFGAEQQQFMDELKTAKTTADSTAITKKMTEKGKALMRYRKDYAKKYPNSLLSKIFNALNLPEVPEGKHYLADGKTEDTAFAYNYYKAHYWDGFDFTDNRLIHAPIYDARLNEYFNRLVMQYEDSVIKEGEALLKKTKNSEELFKYTLWWLTNNAGSSKVMGMDAVYVYFVENYHMKGLATWLSDEDLKKHIDNARKIAPNVIGNLAPDLNMRDTANRDLPLSSVKSKYTLLVFWSPDCGHCKDEMPKLDSVYRAVLKNKGVKIYAVTTLNDEKMWKDFIKEKKLQDWINVWDPEVRTNFRDKYNVYMTPILYLLDEKKIIKGKRIDYTNIAGLLEFLEKKEKAGKQ